MIFRMQFWFELDTSQTMTKLSKLELINTSFAVGCHSSCKILRRCPFSSAMLSPKLDVSPPSGIDHMRI